MDKNFYAHLSDILVSYSADLLDIGGALGNILKGVSGQLKLILDVLRWLDSNTFSHLNLTDDLLADEVSIPK